MEFSDSIILMARPEKHFLESFYFKSIRQGVDAALAGSGISLILSSQDVPIEKIMQTQSGSRVGVLNIAPHVNHESIRALSEASVPHTLVNCRADRSSWVDGDNFLGAESVTEHLIRLGHERILFLNGFPDSQNGRDRFAGYRRAQERYAVAHDPSLVLICDFSVTLSYERLKEYLTRHRPDFSAVFASNDLMAVGAIRALIDQQLKVADDIAVVGYDDFDFAESFYIPLTTYHQPFRNIGFAAARSLLRQMDGRVPVPQQIELAGEIVVRESCGFPRTGYVRDAVPS